MSEFILDCHWLVCVRGEGLTDRSIVREKCADQCCQLSDFVARFSDFSDPFSDFFFFKAPSDKSSDIWKKLSNFANVASTVLRARDLELHLSLCLL